MTLPTHPIDILLYKVRRNLGRGDSHAVINELDIEWYNQAQRDVCNAGLFWFMRGSKTFTFAAGDGSEALPSASGGDEFDFKDEDVVYRVDSGGSFSEMRAMDQEDYVRIFDDTSQGTPTHYIVETSNLFIRPLPDASTTVKMMYWGYLANLVESNANTNVLLSRFPRLLEEKTTAYGFDYLEERENAALWHSKSEASIQDLRVINAERILPNEIVARPRSGVSGSQFGKSRRWRIW